MSLLVVDDATLLVAPPPRSWSDEPTPRWMAPVLPSAADEVLVAAPAPSAEGSRRTGVGARLVDLGLTMAAIIGVVVLGTTVAAHFTGLRPLVVKSGSMEPTIPTGGMVLVRTVPASDVRVGDVVAADRPDNTRVTHRVVDVLHQGGMSQLTLKGDANKEADPLPLVVDEVGMLVYSVPSIGRVSAFLASSRGGFLMGCIFSAVALSVLRRREPSP